MRDTLVLVVDDDASIRSLVAEAVLSSGAEVISAANRDECLWAISARKPDLVFLDLVIPGVEGFSLLQSIVGIAPSAEVVLLTGEYRPDLAVEAIKRGASDYLTKPAPISTILAKIQKVSEALRLESEGRRIERELLTVSSFVGLIGRSPAMAEAFSVIERIAPHFETVLVRGETGTGKELVARAIHDLSPVDKKPFAVLNCAALVETLAESELFGYTRGAFTGALQDKPGLFEYANGGTVFLDEIGEMPLSLQAKLLRVLQNREVQRIGSPVTKKIDVRVIAATHRNLSAMVKQGTFREDLYYRLSILEIVIPPLRDRPEDIILLAQHFLERAAAKYQRNVLGLTAKAKSLLMRHGWPGNVRELENVIARACIMGKGELLDASDFPSLAQGASASNLSTPNNLTLAEVQKRHVLQVLESVKGNKAKASEILGISRSTLYGMLSGNATE